jgi:hypothetical protein
MSDSVTHLCCTNEIVSMVINPCKPNRLPCLLSLSKLTYRLLSTRPQCPISLGVPYCGNLLCPSSAISSCLDFAQPVCRVCHAERVVKRRSVQLDLRRRRVRVFRLWRLNSFLGIGGLSNLCSKLCYVGEHGNYLRHEFIVHPYSVKGPDQPHDRARHSVSLAHELLRAVESGRTALEPKAYMPAELAGTTLDEDYRPGEVKAVFNTRNTAAFLFSRARNL